MIIPALFAALCLIISGIGAWTDIKTGRVFNSHLFIAALAGAILTIVAMKVGVIARAGLIRWTINLVSAILLSAVFYLSDVWAPGDAKLYILVAALFPMHLYAAPSSNIFPALSIVVFAYAAGYIYLVCSAFIRSKGGKQKLKLPAFDRHFLTGFSANAGIIIGAQTLIAAFVPVFFAGNQVLVLMCVVGLCYGTQIKWPLALYILGTIGLATMVATTFITRKYSALFLSLPLSLVIALVTQMLVRMANANSYRVIQGEELRPGMILSLGSILAMQKCIDPNIPRQTTENRRSRLSEAQAEAVRNWCRITKRPITIVEMLPFAPFIFFAIIIELIRHCMFY